jgi:uncharacterized membrane protein YphA (DoxX/SURF4 family)
MNRLITAGRIIFAIGMIALAVLCIISRDFIVGRPPAWPAGWALNPGLAYISAALLMLAALMILLTKKGGLAALSIAVLILLLSVLRHLPHFIETWVNAFKSMALLGGAAIVAASFFKEDNDTITRSRLNGRLEKGLITGGTLLLAVFFIACGYAHFKYPEFVKELIPTYIPFRAFWSYFCGICLCAGGLGLLLPYTRRYAALLSGIMIAGWFVLLHLPRFIANTTDASDRMGLCESFSFVGICFVLAGIYSVKRRYA